jgi:serine phosphatase RsbU (regulator of sigma subunit)
VRCSGDDCGQIVLPGLPLGSFAGVTYDHVTVPTAAGDVYVFCTDGIFEAFNANGAEFGARRLCEVIDRARDLSARGIVDAIFDAVSSFRGNEPQVDDMTAVAIKIGA